MLSNTGPPTVRAVEIGSLSDGQLRQAYEVRQAAHRDAAPIDPFPPYDQWAGLIRHLPPGTRRWHWLADGGYADLMKPDSSATGHVDLRVHPSARRNGLGSVLLAAVCETAYQGGCERILGRLADLGSREFARRKGAAFGNSMIRSLLVLPMPMYPQPVAGYAVTSWTGRAPDALLASYAVSRNAITDAPHTEGDVDDVWTPLRVREFEGIVARRGRQTRVTVVLDGLDVVGFTELRVSLDRGVIASTEDTAIAAGCRGIGLATWIKATSLALLQRDRPDVTGVITGNDAMNAAMLAVNQRLGFRPVATWTDAVMLVVHGRQM